MAPFHFNNVLDHSAVSQQIVSPEWAELTNPNNWDEVQFTDVIANEVEAPWDEISVAPEQCPQDNATLPVNDLRLQEGRVMLGRLAMLHNEILSRIILPMMDFVSITRFSQTCSFAHLLVAQNLEYHILLTHVPKIFPVLRSLHLHAWTSLRDLVLELQQNKCRGCGENGTHIFLPTVERVCSNCLRHNQGFWSIVLQDAKQCFRLENRDLARIPRFRDLSTVFDLRAVRNFVFGPAPSLQLVAVKSALKQAVKVYGSAEAIQALAEEELPGPANSSTWQLVQPVLYAYLRQATLGAIPGDPTKPPLTAPPKDVQFNNAIAEISERVHLNVANISYPYVPRGQKRAIQLYKCKGCSWIVDHFTVKEDHLDYMGIPTWSRKADVDRAMVGATFVTYTKVELREHARSCLGAGLRMYRRRLQQDNPNGPFDI